MAQTRILVAEDEGIVALDIEKQLRELGYEVAVIVASGEEAIAQTAAQGPDLVLMDIMLEGDMDGVEAAQAIHAEQGVPVVFLTAYSDDQTLQRVKRTGPFGYLLKPFERRELYVTIESALSRHEMEKKVKASEERLSTTLNSIGDAVIATDAGGLIEFMNPVAQELTGWTQGMALGRELPQVYHLVDEETRMPVGNPALQAVAAGEKVELTQPALLLAREGWTIPVVHTASPIQDGSGQVIGVVLIFRDMTATREAETRKALLEEQLRQSQKMEAVGQLGAGIAHNFNNALAVITGNLDLLLMDDPENPNLRDAGAAADQAAGMVKQLMLFSRRGVYGRKPVGAQDLIAGVVEMCRGTFDRKISIELEKADTPLRVWGDADQLRQVFLALFINARDALEEVRRQKERSPWIRVELSAPRYEESDELKYPEAALGRYLRVEVSDNGEGMNPAVQERIFEPFYTTKEVGQGTGLGLSAAYAIVNEHGGWIDCESAPGEGSRFSVYLPVIEQGDTEEESLFSGPDDEPRELSFAGRGETILVIEDEELIQRTLTTILQAYGYSVLLSGNGEDGLALFEVRQQEIDLVLLDLSMPRMSGQEVMDRLLELDPRVRVIISTGYDAELVEMEGVQARLEKPFQLGRLVQTVRRVLDGP